MFSKPKFFVLVFSAFFVAYALVGGILERVSARDDTYRGLRVFTDVLLKIRQDYVETPDLTKAMRGGVLEMIETLDPYSSFVDADRFQSLEETDDLNASLGLVVAKRYGYAYVVSVRDGSEADRRGFRTADLIESIDGEATSQLSLWEVRRLLLGKPGTSVRLRVIRFRRTAPVEIEMTREELSLPEVTARIVEEGIGHLAIPHFSEGAARSVSSKLKMLASSSLRGLIVDLRGSAEGTIDQAVQVSDFFLPKGLKVLTVSNRESEEEAHFSLTEPIVSDIPVILLIDGGTSGAAEVFAGALLDHDLAETVGEKTDGKGFLHSTVHLEAGVVLEIATERLYRVNGEPIQVEKQNDSGIQPVVRSPAPDFVSNFYFQENSAGEENLEDEFYRRLNEAIRQEQWEEGMKQVRSRLLEEAA